MTRSQAKALLDNIELIRHFANGGDIGHVVGNVKNGKSVIRPSKALILSNIEVNGWSRYVRLKSRFVFNNELGTMVRKERCFAEVIDEREVIK